MPCGVLVPKLGWASTWVTVWLGDQAQRVVVNGLSLASWQSTSATQQGSALGPVLFNVVGDLEQVTKYTLIRFVDGTRLGGPDSALGGKPPIQRDLGRLEGWAYRNLMKFSEGRCKVLFMGRKNPCQGYRLGDGGAGESSSVGKALGVRGGM